MNADLHAIRTAAAMRAAQQAWDDMAEPEPNEAGEIAEQIRLAEQFIGRAERALRDGNTDAALDHLGCAVRELGEVATEEKS